MKLEGKYKQVMHKSTVIHVFRIHAQSGWTGKIINVSFICFVVGQFNYEI